MYDFYLISVVVIDDHVEGLPVAWAIANHEDTVTLEVFFRSIAKRVHDLHPDIFMSDDADQFYSAFSNVFGHTRKLLCCWHIDRSWRKSINEHIRNAQEVYHQLRVLLLERNIGKFNCLLQQMMSYLHEHHIRFFNYFKKVYVFRCEQWATCHRIGCVVNTNMFTKAFHRLLKVVYLENKQNRRVDKLLHVLFRIACNLIYEQIRKDEKGKTTHRKAEINKWHKNAVALADNCQVVVENLNKDEWKVQSQVILHIVQLADSGCTCKLFCSHCAACVHMYTCS